MSNHQLLESINSIDVKLKKEKRAVEGGHMKKAREEEEGE